MYTKEKRAELEAAGEPWPECHGEPMTWWRSTDMAAGGRFKCRVWHRERMKELRAQRREAEVCVQCQGELETESLCAKCAAAHREASWKHDQGLERQFYQTLHKLRERATDEATGAGFVAFQKWMD